MGDGLVPSPSVVARMAQDLSWRDACREAMSELVDELEAADQAIASAQARKIQAIEAVRVLAVETVRGLDPSLGPVCADDARRVSEIREQQVFARRSVLVEVACALRTPEGFTTSLVHEAQILTDRHPATMAALTDGEISYAHTGVVLENTAALEPDDCRELEAVLVERAKGSTVASLRRFARRERERTHPRPLVERHRERLEERHVELEPARDGMMWLHQYLPAVHATAIYNRLTDIAVTFQGGGEERTLGQLRADVFSALLLDDEAARLATGDVAPGADAEAAPGAEALGSAPSLSTTPSLSTAPSLRTAPSLGAAPVRGAGPRPSAGSLGEGPSRRPGPSLRGVQPSVAVTVPVMTLLGTSEEHGHLEGYGSIDADTARDLAGRATSFTRILTHPETAVVLSVGRRRYSVPADLKSWLRLRDETCRFPGCSRRAERCDIDHIALWQGGGTTDHDNLIHLCRHHHRIKHETGWSVARKQGEESRLVRRGPDEQVPDGRGPDGQVPDGRGPDGQVPDRASGVPSDAFARPDVVTWTSPAGRRYDDHPALPRPTAAALRHPAEPVRRTGDSGLTSSVGGSAVSPDASGETEAGASQDPFPDEPPF